MNIAIKIILGIVGMVFILGLMGFIYVKTVIIPESKIKPAQNQLTESSIFDKNILDSITKYSSETVRNSSILSIAIIDNGDVSYYGIERKNDILKSIEARDSLFQIGSISKVFTSTILADMITKNEINPEETIDKYLGFSLKNDLKIKIKDLVNHSSGLERLHKINHLDRILNIDNPYLSYSDTWMMSYLQNDIEINESLKGKSNYSNLGAAILGFVLSKHIKTSYDRLLLSVVFEKYKMNHSFVYSSKDKDRLVKSYDIDDSLTTNWELNAYSPAGGIVSNIQDMAKFAIAQFDPKNKELHLTQRPTLRLDSNTQIGLGWFIIKSKINHNVLFHNGATGNFNSSMMLDMESKKGIIILSNANYNDTKGSLDKLSSSILNYINTKK